MFREVREERWERGVREVMRVEEERVVLEMSRVELRAKRGEVTS